MSGDAIPIDPGGLALGRWDPARETRVAEAARNDPLGFYHGATVRRGGRPSALTGPPVCFEPGPASRFEFFQTAARDRIDSGR